MLQQMKYHKRHYSQKETPRDCFTSPEKQYKDETKTRLNHLIQNTSFSKRLCNFDLMTSLFSDEELSKLDNDTSCFISYFSDTPEMIQKAIEFVNLRPDIAFYVEHRVSKERFMKTSNYVLIEAIDYMDKHYLEKTEHNIELFARTMIPRITLKRIFGAYKKNDTQEQSESVLVKKKIPPKQNNQN